MVLDRDAFVVDMGTIIVVGFTYKLANYNEYQGYLWVFHRNMYVFFIYLQLTLHPCQLT